VRLGRLPADPAALGRSPAHRFGLVEPPAVLDRSLADFGPQAYGNMDYPDCTAATLANCARAVSYLNGYDLTVDPATPLEFYGNFLGNPPDLADTDGANVVELLTYQGARGFNIGPQSLVANWGTIDTTSRSALARCLSRLGPVYLGITLREREMDTSAVWDVVSGRDDGPKVGGHAVPLWSYAGLADDSICQIGTWGRWQAVTWGWLAARLDEAHGLVWRQLEKADGFYIGLTPDGLAAEL